MDKLLRGDSSASVAEKATPNIAHGIAATLAWTKRTGMDVRSMWLKGIHARSACCEGDVLAPSRNWEQRETTVRSHGMAENMGNQKVRPICIIPAQQDLVLEPHGDASFGSERFPKIVPCAECPSWVRT